MDVAVVVELPAEDAGSPYAEALLRACTAGMRRGECVLADRSDPSPTPNAVAIVTWSDAERLEVLVELGRQRDGRPVWTSRQLHFQPADATEERWKSMGFAVASLRRDQ